MFQVADEQKNSPFDYCKIKKIFSEYTEHHSARLPQAKLTKVNSVEYSQKNHKKIVMRECQRQVH